MSLKNGEDLIDIDDEVKANLHRLEDLVNALIAEADDCIVGGDMIISEFDDSVFKFKGEPERIVFELKLEAQAIMSAMDYGFRNQKFDNEQFEREIAVMEKSRYSESHVVKQLEMKAEKLKQRIGYRIGQKAKPGLRGPLN